MYWVVVRPSTQLTYAQGDWPNVLWFSALLLSLGLAVLLFGRMVGGETVTRWTTVAGAAVSLASLVNIVEDGFRIEAAFLLFVLCILTLDIALIGSVVVIARAPIDRYRLYALVPAGTLAGILFFIAAGGPIFLVTWLGAAAAALRMASGPLNTAREQA